MVSITFDAKQAHLGAAITAIQLVGLEDVVHPNTMGVCFPVVKYLFINT